MSLGQRRVCVPTASSWSCVSREIYKVEQRKIARYSRVSYHQKGTRTILWHFQNYLAPSNGGSLFHTLPVNAHSLTRRRLSTILLGRTCGFCQERTCPKIPLFGKVKKSFSRNDKGKRHFQKGGSIIVFGKAVHLSARFDK